MNNKRENIVSTLISEGWKPNLEYLNGEYLDLYWVVSRYADNRGKFYTESNDGTKSISNDNFLISPSKRYALTVKSKTITLHDAQKNYYKILSMEIVDIEIKEYGLKSGALMLLYED